jgi:hypothetical protein
VVTAIRGCVVDRMQVDRWRMKGFQGPSLVPDVCCPGGGSHWPVLFLENPAPDVGEALRVKDDKAYGVCG